MHKHKVSARLAALLLSIFALGISHVAPAAAQACAPNICCATNPTIGTPACGAAAGNPLNVMSGNKFQREEDMPALPGVLGLELVRYYNSEASIADHRGILGRGWRLSYDAELVVRPGGNIITVHQGDGTQTLYAKPPFQPEPNTTIYGSNLPGGGTLRLKRAASGNPLHNEYILSPAGQGNRQTFDAQGKLVLITAPTGEFVSLQRDAAGLLVRVTDPQGRFLALSYLPKRQALAGDRFSGVQHIDSPVGRFGYTYGSTAPAGSAVEPIQLLANLVKVSLPTHYDAGTPANPAGGSADRGVSSSSVSKTYHYEDARRPSLLTGISVQGQGSDGQIMSQRLATWGYDAKGRANLSVKGSHDPAKPGAEQVTLEFNVKTSDGSGTTTLTNSLGQTTRYSYAQIKGQPQLLEVRGAGCASCGPVNVRYRYDERGRQTEQLELDDKGMATRGLSFEYDGIDRPRQVNAFSVRNGKAGPPRMQVRYEYGADPQNRLPLLIARPSVVAGKEYQIRIAYNDKGQPITVTESGYELLEHKPITRTSRYAYSEINGRSVLAQIDGPLPNGPRNSPADSDVTQVAWDKAGSFIVGIEEPGERRSSVQYSISGLIAQVQNGEGAITRFDYTTSGQVERITTEAPGWQQPRVQVFRRDALGRVTEAGEQTSEDAGYRARFAQGFDVAGRLQWRASRLGLLEQHGYDTESRVIQSGRYSNSMAQSLNYEFDEQGRLRGLRDNSGAAYQFSYDAQGAIARVTDPFGDLLPAPSPATHSALRKATPRQMVDDFGRTVATLSPDSGRTLREYNAADQMIASRDALGNQARYEYDLRGRIQRHTVSDVQAKQDSQTVWHYQGRYLARLEHPDQNERYAYDARGLRTSKTTTLKTPAGERTSATHYEYDAQGRLQAMSLPDGSLIAYQRNGQGQVVALHRQRVRTAWLRWALADQIIVKDLQRDIVGIKAYTSGNGIAAQLQRSNAGVLTRMVYRNKREASLHSASRGLAGMATAHAGTSGPSEKAPASNHLPGATGLPTDPQALIDHRYLWDTRGNLLLRQDNEQRGIQGQSYAYDLQSRLIASASEQEFNRYAYDAMGRRVLAQQGGKDQASMQGTARIGYAADAPYRWVSMGDAKTRIQAHYNANGEPQAIGERKYIWDALGRLAQIRSAEKVIAAYVYNHRGERISKLAGQHSAAYLYEDKQLAAELDGQGRIKRQYIYLADAPVAAIDTPHGVSMATGDSFNTVLDDFRTIAAGLFAPDNTLVWLHTNHLGAPEAVTNADAKLIWQASYSPFGQVQIKADNFRLDMRLPGQYADEESGLYYNRQRYYDPEQGRYLTPDPLGTPNGPNRYAYVNYNPLKYVDPEGLVLFAFDGTENSDPVLNPGVDTLSNVVLFRNLYDDGNKRYITGVATVDRSDPTRPIQAPILDAGVNWSGPERIQRMIEYFDDEADLAIDDNMAMDVDIVGFSRGAAQARDFANRIATNNGFYKYKDKNGKDACQMVNLRFMGLWDTVLSNNWSAYSYNLAIPTQFKYVVQAVALNEYRGHTLPLGRANVLDPHSWGSFPLESIMGGALPAAQTRIERGFIGAHSDIGGGFQDNELSKVALAWMIEQAGKAGVKINTSPISIVANAVMHDKSDAIRFGSPTAGTPLINDGQWNEQYAIAPSAVAGSGAEDRLVRYRDGTTTTQRKMIGAGMSYGDSAEFIAYDSVRNRSDNITGTVDIKGYVKWLRESGYDLKYLQVH